MIDANSEELIALNEVPNRLPKRRGKRLHYSTAYRWATHGVRGRKLETLRVGGMLYTSAEAIGRFLSSNLAPHEPVPRTSSRQRDIDRANAVLDREGVR